MLRGKGDNFKHRYIFSNFGNPEQYFERKYGAEEISIEII
jgi:hypothetical protein